MDKARSEASDKRLMGGLVLVGVVVFAIAVGVGQLLDAKPGTLADWIAATATLAALMAASYAGVQTGRTFRLEQKRDAQRDEDRRRQQAELVAVWAGMIESIGPQVTIKWEPGEPARQSQAAGVIYPTSIPVTIRNASALPVYAMAIDIYFGDPSTEVAVLGGRYEVQDEVRGLAVFGTIEGIEVATPDVVASMVSVLKTLPGPRDEPRTVSIGCSFKDNAGLRWRRNPGGGLESDDQPRPGIPEIHSPVSQTPTHRTAQEADGARRTTSFLNGLAVGGPLDGAVVQVETGALQ